MAETVRLDLDEQAIADTTRTPEFRALVKEVGERTARGMSILAPHLTGAGARSIGSALVNDPRTGWESDVGWDRDHHYLYFHDVGTRYMPARPFVQPALDRYARL